MPTVGKPLARERCWQTPPVPQAALPERLHPDLHSRPGGGVLRLLSGPQARAGAAPSTAASS